MRSSRPADAASRSAGAVVRVACDDAGWARALPPVPAGSTVTVSLGHPAPAEQRAQLEARGYRLVGVFPSMLADPETAVADLLVPEGLIEEHPAWWRDLTTGALRVYSLQHGPVRRAFGLL
ncbi:MAG: hypothetical protein LC789_10105 [Actinobacteria bacterium]|nr:hypothetical protein [Actinomycetota bacterium]